MGTNWHSKLVKAIRNNVDLFEKLLEAMARFWPIDWLMQLMYYKNQ